MKEYLGGENMLKIKVEFDYIAHLIDIVDEELAKEDISDDYKMIMMMSKMSLIEELKKVSNKLTKYRELLEELI
jgi:hypothetical protein